MIQQDQAIKTLQERQSAAYQRELKPNLIIQGILPVADEDHTKLIESVKDFFTQQLEIEETIEIVDAFRLGKTESKPVMIKLTLFNDKALIYSHSKNLKGKKNSKHKAYYIRDDTTEEQDEIRRLYKSLLTENDEQVDEQKKFTVSGVKS